LLANLALLRHALPGREQPPAATLARRLERLVDGMPQPAQTVLLRPALADVAGQLYHRFRTADDAGQPELKAPRAQLAGTWKTWLSSLGRGAEALGPAQEAVELCQALARQQPDAFNPDLARALGALGLVLAANEPAAEARACFAEGIRVLTPVFLTLPEAHQALMAGLVEWYQQLSAELGEAPDAALLGPVLPVLEKLWPSAL
jgi:tetratricopeptide (TPR) repeat protein